MQSLYVAANLGSPKFAGTTCGPLPHFHLIRSLAGSLLALTCKLAPAASKQPRSGMGGQSSSGSVVVVVVGGGHGRNSYVRGHWAEVPVQRTSAQPPLPGWQIDLVSSKASGGHTGLTPSQLSVTSQGPLDGRHSTPAPMGITCSHEPLPSHLSPLQGSPSSGHVVPAPSNVQADEQQSPFAVLPSSQS